MQFRAQDMLSVCYMQPLEAARCTPPTGAPRGARELPGFRTKVPWFEAGVLQTGANKLLHIQRAAVHIKCKSNGGSTLIPAHLHTCTALAYQIDSTHSAPHTCTQHVTLRLAASHPIRL
jgi:hypothetical protein